MSFQCDEVQRLHLRFFNMPSAVHFSVFLLSSSTGCSAFWSVPGSFATGNVTWATLSTWARSSVSGAFWARAVATALSRGRSAVNVLLWSVVSGIFSRFLSFQLFPLQKLMALKLKSTIQYRSPRIFTVDHFDYSTSITIAPSADAKKSSQEILLPPIHEFYMLRTWIPSTLIAERYDMVLRI